MSLQVWLPLNGSLENKGTADITFSSGTPKYVDGHMGKAIDLSNRVNFTGLPKLTKFTITFWAKVDSSTGDWADLLGLGNKAKDGSSATVFRFEATKTTRACSFHNNDVYGITKASRILIQNYKEWHHVALSCDGTKLYSYKDGVLSFTDDALGGYLINSFYIGESPITGAMNDLRIYDDVLSKTEIKEIYKGLILHYPLGNGYGNENLLIGSQMDKDYSNKNWVRFGLNNVSKSEYINGVKHIVTPSEGQKRNNGEGFAWTDITTSPLEVGETYTFSVDIMGIISSESEGGDLAYMYNSTEDAGVYEKIFFITRFRNSLSATHYNRYSMTFTVPSTAKYKFACQLMLGWGADIYYKNVKLEKGKNSNPIWTPNPSDALYKTLGYNTTEYDTSGFGNNGTKFGTITSSSDSPIGNSSYYIPSTAYINTNSALHTNNQITMSIWFKGANGCHFGNWESGGCGLWTEGNKWKATVYANSKYNDITGGALQDGWHFAAMTYDGQVIKIYNDGVETGKLDLGSKYAIQWHATAPWTINGNPNATGSSVDQRVTGYWADARLYATALTADDIKQLYQTKAKIDKNGNLYGNQFVEVDNERNLCSVDQYPTSPSALGTYKGELIDCSDSVTGKATKLTCTVAGSGFYMSGYNVFNKSNLINGKQYMISMYVKSDNRTSVKFNVECSSKQSKGTFTIGNNYRRICIIYTYSNTQTYSAFTCYSDWKVDENIYIHSLKVTEYNPKSHVKNNSVIETNSFTEIGSENETKLYKQDIQTNQIIEI